MGRAMRPRSSAVRLSVIVVLVGFFGLAYLPDLVRVFGYPLGDWGLTIPGDGRSVATVRAEGPAARAGIRVGDRVDLSSASSRIMLEVLGGAASAPGAILHLRVIHNGRARLVALRAIREPPSWAPLLVLREVIWLLPVALGVLLLVLRPSPTTWGFFLFSLGAGGQPPTAIGNARIIPPSIEPAWMATTNLLYFALPRAGLVLFAFSLARRSLKMWRTALIVFAGLLGLIQAVPLFAINPDFIIPSLTLGCEIGGAMIAILALFDAYQRVSDHLRQRLYWISIGLVLWVTVSITDALLWPVYETYQFHTAIDVSQLIFPSMVAYALLHERVVDIRFALSKTLVYSILTAMAVAVFALIDAFLSRGIAAGRLSLPIDVFVAIALGFFFHGIHGTIDIAVDRFLFRQRHDAEIRLARAANAVLHVHSDAAVAEYLVEVPGHVLNLTSVALYRRNDQSFALEKHASTSRDLPRNVALDDPLVAYLSAELGPVRLSEIEPETRALAPSDKAVLALPLLARRELGGFVLYGAHRDGADIDPDEIKALIPLVANAAITYDHLEAAALREENAELRATFLTLRR